MSMHFYSIDTYTHFEHCKRIPQQGRSLCSSFVLKFSLIVRQDFNLLKGLALESRNIQTQKCAPIQCTVWPRKEKQSQMRELW